MFFEKQKQKRVTVRRRCSAALQQNEDSAGNTNSAALQAKMKREVLATRTSS
jgi:hypothetical protein